MTDVFISYAKADNEQGAITTLVKKLNATPSPAQPDSKITTWFDESGIRKGENWKKEIDVGLEKTNTVAIFISPCYFASLICNYELQTSLELGKKLIPVWVANISAGEIEREIAVRQKQGKETATLSEAMQNYASVRDSQAIRYDTDADAEKARTLQEIITAIFENARLDDGATHWLERALAHQRGTGGWLTGADLTHAEQWLIEAERTPNFTVHGQTRDFIFASRRTARQRRLTLGGVGLFLMVALSVAGLVAVQQTSQRQASDALAARNQLESESRRLASEAVEILNNPAGNNETAALLSIRALKAAYTEQADNSLLRALEGLHTTHILTGDSDLTDVRRVMYSPDGSQIMTLSRSTSPQRSIIRVHDARTGIQLYKIEGDEKGFLDAIYSADGRLFLTHIYNTPILRAYDSQSGGLVWEHFPVQQAIKSMQFHPSGTSFMVGYDSVFQSKDTVVVIFDANTREELFRVAVASADPNLVSYDDFNLAVITTRPSSSGIGYYLTVYDTRTWTLRAERLIDTGGGTTGDIRSLALNISRVFVGMDDGTVREYSTAGEEIQRYSVGSLPITSITAVPPERAVVAVGGSHLYLLQNGEVVRTLSGSESAPTVAMHPDGLSMVSWTDDAPPRVWRLTTDNDLLLPLDKWLRSSASADGRSFVVSDGLKTYLWHEEQFRFINSDILTLSVALRADGQQVALTTPNGTKILTPNGDILGQFQIAYENALNSVKYSPDGRYLLVTATDPLVDVIDAGSGDPVVSLPLDEASPLDAAFNGETNQIAVGMQDGSVQIWDFPNGQLRYTLTHAEVVNRVVYHPHDNRLLTASGDGTARLWRGETPLLTLQHNSPVIDAQFSQDGRLILTFSDDDILHLWDSETGELIRRMAFPYDIDWVFMTQVGNKLFVHQAGAGIRSYDLLYEDFITSACRRIFRDFSDAERQQFNITYVEPTCREFEPMDIVLPTETAQPVTITPAPALPAATAIQRLTVTPSYPQGSVSSESRVNLRAGAGTNFAVVSGIEPGTIVNIIRSNQQGDWLYIRTQDGIEAWINTSFIRRR